MHSAFRCAPVGGATATVGSLTFGLQLGPVARVVRSAAAGTSIDINPHLIR
jgi:hypothetical protein